MGGREERGFTSGDDTQAARDAMRWIVGRLNVLEFLVLGLALLLALLGGALVAWILSPALPLSFRWTWALVSLLLFILPGGFVYLREARWRRVGPGSLTNSESDSETKESNG